jgi:hypothetical protein
MSTRQNRDLKYTFQTKEDCQAAIGSYVRKLSDKTFKDGEHIALVVDVIVHEQTGRPAFLLADRHGMVIPGSMVCGMCYYAKEKSYD